LERTRRSHPKFADFVDRMLLKAGVLRRADRAPHRERDGGEMRRCNDDDGSDDDDEDSDDGGDEDSDDGDSFANGLTD
jgi:hypothetical protein